jgi:protein-disulfide isomerase
MESTITLLFMNKLLPFLKANLISILSLVAVLGIGVWVVTQKPATTPTPSVSPIAVSSPTPVTIIVTTSDIVLGSASAPVTIVEYTDFQCSYCKRFFDETHAQLVTQYVKTNQVRLVVRNFPLPFHANAEKAAEAALCAAAQNKYWEMHDMLFAKSQGDGTGLAVTDLKQYAKTLELDTAKFNTCLDTGEKAAQVRADLEGGQQLGVTGTPAFFINDTLLLGAQPFTAFQTAIADALK